MSHHRRTFDMILASTLEGGIGLQGTLPWKLAKDMQHFKSVTTHSPGSAVIMGRNTWDSLKGRILPGRDNAIISKTLKSSEVPKCTIFPSLNEALHYYAHNDKKAFVIGGRQLYEEGAYHPDCKYVYRTRIANKIKCDVTLPKDLFNHFRVLETSKTFSENEINFDMQRLINGNANQDENLFFGNDHEEFQYLNMINHIISNGTQKNDRTNVGTISTFGNLMRYSLQHSFPLLTTKKVFFKGVVEELLWFIKGQTDGKLLLNKNVKIWEGNGSRQYLDAIGLTEREEHDLGPIYGFQWRHFGARYSDKYENYEGQGVDQLKQVIHQIKHNPDSRRIILSAWNPVDLPQMALPPCHVMSQFYVQNSTLSCMMYQRSCDFGLGVPFNIASYALLTCMLADLCGLERGEFVHVLGDTHIYSNHVEQLKEQTQRIPYPFPHLKIKNKRQNIEDYQLEDFELLGYQTHDKISMKMAV